MESRLSLILQVAIVVLLAMILTREQPTIDIPDYGHRLDQIEHYVSVLCERVYEAAPPQIKYLNGTC